MNRKEKKERESLIDLLGGKKNAIALLIVLILGITGEMVYFTMEAQKEREARYTGSIPMANQHIEWTYAGKGGFQ